MRPIIAAVLILLGHAFTVSGQQAPSLRYIQSFQEPRDGLNEPQSLFYDDRRNELLVTNTNNHEIDIFSPDGIPVSRLGSEREGLFQFPLGCAVFDGVIYVSETQTGNLKTVDYQGNISGTIRLDTLAGKYPVQPGRFCIDRDGTMYLVDRKNCRILVLNNEQTLLFTIGGPGTGPGKFRMPEDVAVDRQGRIYVTDSQGIPVQVFDRAGSFIFDIGVHGLENEQFSVPRGVVVDERDYLWVVDSFRHHIKVFDNQGNFVTQLGTHGPGEGRLFFPVDICFGSNGRLYVLERGARRVQVFECFWN